MDIDLLEGEEFDGLVVDLPGIGAACTACGASRACVSARRTARRRLQSDP